MGVRLGGFSGEVELSNLPTNYPDEAAEATLEEIKDILDGVVTTELTPATVTALEGAFTSSLSQNHTDLQAIAGELNDIYSELLEKFEAGQDVGLEGPDMDYLATAIATLFHYPTDYPDAGANTKLTDVKTKLDTLHTDLASTTATAANQATANTKLDTLHTDLTTTTATSALQTTANTKLDTLHTDLGHLTDNTQTTRITNGTNTADVLAGDAGQNALIAVGPQKTISWSASTTGAVPATQVDVGNYSVASFTFPGMGAGDTIRFEGSNDNFVTDTVVLPWTFNFGATNNGAFSGAQTHEFIVPLTTRYIRVNVNAVNGTVSGFMTLRSVTNAQPPYPVTVVPLAATFPISGAVSQASGNAWVTGGALSSVSNNASTSATTGSTTTYTASFSWWGMQVIVGGTGSLSALTVVLEGSADGGTTWKTVSTYSGTASDYVVNTSPMPFQTIRTRITTLTVGSGTPTVTTRIVGCQ